ncbi:hypothetical protein N0Q90_21355 (plasmid) [Sinorhizobium sp. M103]|uniref:hypothetical protein n=1 Tax=Sinorhizobium sp. M103 TaxID=2976821 RepID=UPI0023D8C415|nr:hypothetical protein [Sinorhizobium sp. M103]WEJ12298.1 hypothetical protein N0Q90_21355 [Sinorhizobium sp. M103]
MQIVAKYGHEFVSKQTGFGQRLVESRKSPPGLLRLSLRFDQFALRDCRAHDGAGVDFLSAFRQQCAPCRHGLMQCH